nr:PSD1 and planctomycete cytochrome C domain-containing protein [Neorhodopirellula pilleata]
MTKWQPIMRFLNLALASCIMIAWSSVRPCRADDSVDFNRDIRSVLSDKCFLCHGPDEETREAGLRLDVREDAIDFSAIVPGSPAESEIISRITSRDPDVVMPPPSTGKTISDQELESIVRWIQDDAPYAEHYAFVPPRRPDLPTVADTTWPRNEIDYFVLAKLEERSMSPSPPATPETLARRLSLDLIGLPPTIDQLDRVAKQAGDVIENLIDELTTSVHFGERWGRWWLDAARYADSAGYEKDMQRSVYFYRDWVVNAFNRDLPYDQFIIEQIGGDLLPGATQDQRVATGFLRNSMTNEEGGADPEQFRVEGMFDRMDAIGKAVLGITTQCAQCHTHKYDPLSHHEYYSMFAALNDFHEACISVYTPEQAERRDQVLSQIRSIENELKTAEPDRKSKVAAWADEVAASLPAWKVMKPTEHPYVGEKFKILDDGSVVSESYAPTKADNSFSLTTRVGTITAVRVDALTHPQLPRGGPGRSIDGTGALTEFKMTIEPTAEGAKPIDVQFVRAISDVNPKHQSLKPQYRDKDPNKDDRVVGPVEYAIDGDVKTAWTTDNDPGRRNHSRHAIFVPESPIVIDGDAKLTFTMTMKHGGWNSDDNQNFLIGRYRFSITDADTIPDSTVDTSIEPILDTPADERSAAQWNALFSQWIRVQDSYANEVQQIEALWQSYPETTTQLVARSLAKPRETFVYSRGDFLRPADKVEPDVPAFLNPLPDTNEPDRLRFARWLVSKDSPTTPRVIVNRIWQAYFGRGLVTTPEDFGFQSPPPSHPELLDFLARELIDSGWSLKHIHRLIVQSATYRQASAAPAEAWKNDPSNQWLSRGPRVRVEAEMVRDLALSVSGLLNTRVGGPAVYPPAPDFLFQPPTSYGPKIWNHRDDAAQYRRSLYVHQYRSVPYPPLQVFDAPKGDAACVRRERSNTPLQALVMLNEPQFVDAARALAARTLREVDTNSNDQHVDDIDAARIRYAFRWCTSRFPDADEVKLLAELLNEQREHWNVADCEPREGEPREGELTGGEPIHQQRRDQRESWVGLPADRCLQLTGAPATELAAWMTVCRAILNLDETITK